MIFDVITLRQPSMCLGPDGVTTGIGPLLVGVARE